MKNVFFLAIAMLLCTELRASVESYGTMAFGNLKKLNEVWSYREEPVECAKLFNTQPWLVGSPVLYVPEQSRDKYAATMPWALFYEAGHLQTFSPASIDAPSAFDDKALVPVFDLQGRRVAQSKTAANLAPGLYVVGGRKWLVR